MTETRTVRLPMPDHVVVPDRPEIVQVSEDGRAFITGRDIIEYCGPELTAWIQKNCTHDPNFCRWWLPVYPSNPP